MNNQICLNPVEWGWIPITIMGCWVMVNVFLNEANKKNIGKAALLTLIGLIVTTVAAYPFFLSWITK